MISELRRRVSTTGTATITVDEFNQLQREWITRVGAESMVAAEHVRIRTLLLGEQARAADCLGPKTYRAVHDACGSVLNEI